MGAFFTKWSQTSLVLRILVGLLIGVILGLTVPQWTFISVLGLLILQYWQRRGDAGRCRWLHHQCGINDKRD